MRRALSTLVAASLAASPVARAGPAPAEAPTSVESPTPEAAPAPEAAPTPPADPPAPASAPASTPASGPAPAPVKGARALAVLPIALTGAADETIRAQLLTHLQSGLARGAFALVDPAVVARHAPGECSDRACVTGLAKATAAGFVLRPVVRVDDRDYVVRLELYAAADGATLAESEERCDLCGFAEVGALVESQAALLRKKIDGLIHGPPRLSVATQPAGALVLVDNQLVGRSPVERTLQEGEHQVRVMLDGYVGDERKVKLLAGVHETLELPLRREPRITRFRQIGMAGIGIGVPLVAGGLALLILDGRPYKGRCDAPDNRDPQGDCRFQFNTDWGGAVSLAAGAALITAGAVLLLRTREKAPPRRRAHVLPAGLGVVGRF